MAKQSTYEKWDKTNTYRDMYAKLSQGFRVHPFLSRRVPAMWNHFFKKTLNAEKGKVWVDNTEYFIDVQNKVTFRVM